MTTNELLRDIAEVMGCQDLGSFAGIGDVCADDYGYGVASIEQEAGDKARHGARRFLECLAEAGCFPKGTRVDRLVDSSLPDRVRDELRARFHIGG